MISFAHRRLHSCTTSQLAAFLCLFNLAVLAPEQAHSAPSSGKVSYSAIVDGYMQKGGALRNDQRFKEGETAQRQALAEALKVLSMPDQAYTIACIHLSIAECLDGQGKNEEAIKECDEALIYLNALKKQYDSSWRLQCMIKLLKAKLLIKLQQTSRAQPLLEYVISRCEADDKYRFNSLDYYHQAEAEKLLADAYVAENNFSEAKSHYEKSIRLPSLSGVPENSPGRLDTLRSYMSLLVRTGERAKADKINARIQDIERHPAVEHACGTGMAQHHMWLNWKPPAKSNR